MVVQRVGPGQGNETSSGPATAKVAVPSPSPSSNQSPNRGWDEDGGYGGGYDDEYGYRPPPAPKKPLGVRLEGVSESHAVISRFGEIVVEDFTKRTRATKTSMASAPPKRGELLELEHRANATLLIARVKSALVNTTVDYAIVLPPDFDLARAPGYKVQTVLPPLSGSLNEVLQDVLKAKPQPGTIRVIPDPKADEADVHSTKDLRALVEQEILPLLQKDFPLALDTYAVLDLPPVGKASVEALDKNAATPSKLRGIAACMDGEWKETLPTLGESAPCSLGEKTGPIPDRLAKQPAGNGGFFMPVIRSEALGKPVRAGIYLPPGYDPKGGEQYPVLFLLPGRRNPLSNWLIAGRVVERLDGMMSGAAQKMIVVIADNNDSYFVNSPPKESGTKRLFQDHVVKELVNYVTTSLRGDKERMSIAGVSRGAFGAFVAAGQHPGMFKAVASYSGVVGLERCPGKDDSPDELDHNGPNPTRLALRGAFSTNGMRVHVEVGDDDKHVATDAMELAGILKGKGVDVDYEHLKANDGTAAHDWRFWGARFEDWVAWHQASFGKSGKPSTRLAAKNLAPEKLKQYQETIDEKWKTKADDVARMSSTLKDALRERESLQPGDLPPWVSATALDTLKTLAGECEAALKDATAVLAGRGEGPLQPEHSSKIDTSSSKISRLRDQTESLKRSRELWRGVLPRHKETFRGVFQKLPDAAENLVLLFKRRPDLFDGVDPLTQKSFSTQLAKHVEEGFVKPSEEKGFSEFLRRIGTKTWRHRETGYHQANFSMVIALEHPGILLGMIESAKKDEKYELTPGWKEHRDVGANAIELPKEFKDPFKKGGSGSTVSVSSSMGFGFSGPSSSSGSDSESMGYEKGFIRTIVDLIPPEALSSEWKSKKHDPVAFALSRLTGRDFRYGAAHKMKTGEDLAEALALQGGGWIAASEARVTTGTEYTYERSATYPIFYDYDPANKTVAVQDSSHTEERFAIGKIKFSKPAIYYSDLPGIERFLTLDEDPDSKPAVEPERPTPAPDQGARMPSFHGAKVVERGNTTSEEFRTRLNRELRLFNDPEVAIRVHYKPVVASSVRIESAIIPPKALQWHRFEINGKVVWLQDVQKVEITQAIAARPKPSVSPPIPPTPPPAAEPPALRRPSDPSVAALAGANTESATRVDLEKGASSLAEFRERVGNLLDSLGDAEVKLLFMDKQGQTFIQLQDKAHSLVGTAKACICGEKLSTVGVERLWSAAKAVTATSIATPSLPPSSQHAVDRVSVVRGDLPGDTFALRAADLLMRYSKRPLLRVHIVDADSKDHSGVPRLTIRDDKLAEFELNGERFDISTLKRVDVGLAPPTAIPKERWEKTKTALSKQFSLDPTTHRYDGRGSSVGLVELIPKLTLGHVIVYSVWKGISDELAFGAVRTYDKIGSLDEHEMDVVIRHVAASDLPIL